MTEFLLDFWEGIKFVGILVLLAIGFGGLLWGMENHLWLRVTVITLFILTIIMWIGWGVRHPLLTNGTCGVIN